MVNGLFDDGDTTTFETLESDLSTVALAKAEGLPWGLEPKGFLDFFDELFKFFNHCQLLSLEALNELASLEILTPGRSECSFANA